MKKRLSVLLTLFFTIYLVTYVSAGVYISQPEASYNIGDSINLDVTIDPIVDGPFRLRLFCDGKSVDVFNGPPIENIVLPLNYLWIGDLKGHCYFLANYGSEEKRTNPDFIISNKLNVILDTNSFSAKPGDLITVTGKATRENGRFSDGEVEVVIPFNAVSNTSNASNNKFYGKLSNGVFLISIRLPGDVPPGDFRLDVNAYEQSLGGEKLNSGSALGNIRVSQVLQSIDLALNNQNIYPGDNLSIKPTLLDQVGKPFKDQATLLIVNDNSDSIFESVLSSGETTVFNVPTNLPSAYYTIKASSGDKTTQKNFFVYEKPRIVFEIRNETLFVKNIGNTRYNKEIQVELNGKKFVKKVDLGLGESKEFYLSGENQGYSLTASDGESQINADNVMLTGHAVDVSDSRYSVSAIFTNPILWIFLLLLILLAIFLLLRKVIKRRSVAKPREHFSRSKQYIGKPKGLKLDHVIRPERKEEEKKQIPVRRMVVPPFIPPTEAEQGLVATGHRNSATLIVVKLKNGITPFAKEFVQKAINPVYEKKGAVYEHGEYIIAVLSPLVTKSFKNELEGAKLGEKISSYLGDYNKKFKEHIEFGVGIHSGEIINEVKDRKLIFTALGNTLALAKKLSEYSKGEVLLSEEIYHKCMSEIKADKKTFGDIDAYRIKTLVDYDKNKKFIDDFLKRAEKDTGVKYVRRDGELSRNRVGSGVTSANSILKDVTKNPNPKGPDGVVDLR